MYIQSLELYNIKAFEKLELDFSRPDTSLYAGMNIFVGGNSSGKSTLLKGIAMALSGPTIANQQLINPAGWVRRGSTNGQIELKVQGSQSHDKFRGKGAPSEWLFTTLQFEYDSSTKMTSLKAKEHRNEKDTRIQTPARGPWNPESNGWFLAAYGPLRRLTGSSTDALRYALAGGKLSSCVTLFREDAALSESETWLKLEHARTLEQKNQGQAPSSLVQQVQEFLNDGLLPEGFCIDRVSVDNVYMKTPNGGELPMRDLSDGCRSAFALMLDIIHSMTLAFRDQHQFLGPSESSARDSHRSPPPLYDHPA